MVGHIDTGVLLYLLHTQRHSQIMCQGNPKPSLPLLKCSFTFIEHK